MERWLVAWLLLCRVLAVPVVLAVPARGLHPLPVLWMMPAAGRSGAANLTAGVAPAVRLALQDVKNQPPPMGNYEIQLQLLDSQCDPAEALKALFDAMWAGPKYLLLLGGVCPPVTAVIGRALPALHLVQVSFAAAAPSLSSRRWYGSVFSTVPSDRALNQAAVKLLQRHKWSRVGVVTQDGPRLSEMKQDLLRQLLKAGVQVASTGSLSEDVCSSLKKLKDLDVRIIVAQFEDDLASEVFCCAYRLNLFGARYQWIVAAGGAGGWRLGWRRSGCSADGLRTAADGSLRLQLRALSGRDAAGTSGRTPAQYQQSYLREAMAQGSEVSPLHAFAYDAVWVAARALSRTAEALRRREKHRNRTAGDGDGDGEGEGEGEGARMLLDALKTTHFQGVTGSVSFRHGERMASIEVVQFQGSSGVLVGEFSIGSQQLRLMTHLLQFKGVGPARDRPAVLLHRAHTGLLLHAVMSLAAAVTMVTTTAVLGAVTAGRRHRAVASGGGALLPLLLLGLLLTSSSTLLSGLHAAPLSASASHSLCSARVWTLSLGHSLSVCALIGCCWRLQSAQERAGRLPLAVLPLDALLLTLWQIVDPLRRVELRHITQSDPADPDSVTQLVSECCSSKDTHLWTAALCVYKAPLLLCGCLLAWRVRLLEAGHPALAGSLLTLSTAAVAASSASGFVGTALTSLRPSVHFVLSGVLVLGCNVFVLLVLFGPKVLYMWWYGSELQAGSEEEEEEEDEEQQSLLKQQLQRVCAQLDLQMEALSLQLAAAAAEPERLQRDAGLRHAGIEPVTHEAQICARQDTWSLNDINAPELMRRRLSIQLPILHHSYLPVIGGISCSSSSLFDDCLYA